MAYVPPHLRKKLASVVTAPPPSGVRFIGNATGELDIAPNTGIRFNPSMNANPRKSSRKQSARRVSPNTEPFARPTTAFSEMPAKFQEMLRHSGIFNPRATRRKHKKHKKSRTRKHR